MNCTQSRVNIFLLELEAAVREKDVATSEWECLKRRTEVLMTDCEQEKKEKFETKVYTSTIPLLTSLQLLI